MKTRSSGSRLAIIISTATLFLALLTLTASSVNAELVVYWSLDEGKGEDVIDATGNGYDGEFKGDPQWVEGMYGMALEFDGDDYVEVSGLADLNPTSITMSAWVSFNRVEGYRQDFLSRADDYAFTLGGDEQNQRVHAVITTAGDWLDMIGDTVVETGTWYYVTLAFDEGSKKFTLYVDGEVDAEQEAPGGMENRLGGVFTIGTYQDRYLEGMLDEIRIWDSALSEERSRNPWRPRRLSLSKSWLLFGAE